MSVISCGRSRAGRMPCPATAAPRAERAVTDSLLDGDAHRARGARDDLLGGLDVVGVEIGHLLLRDLAQLLLADGADLGRLRRAGTLLDTRRLDQQLRRRRGLQDELERAVFVHADLRG